MKLLNVCYTIDVISILVAYIKTRKLCYRKDDCATRLKYECPEFLRLPDYTYGYFCSD